VGAHNGVYCSASGKALLFDRTEDEIRSILSKIQIIKKTKNTMTDIDEIVNEIIKSKARGYALDIEESEDDVGCIAAPIIASDGSVVAAVSIAGLVSNIISPRRLDELKDMLLETTKQISLDLGMPNI
jgi:DNA-binding IclR family transcriptional regulator